jgi:trans-aconitate 2-methyltransferase
MNNVGKLTTLGWNARKYDTLPLPHERWGLEVIRRLNLVGDETVLELGCGTGRDVSRLLDQLPRGRVVAVDASPAMLDQLRERLAHRLDRVMVLQSDLREPLGTEHVQAAMSVATLHWIRDHDTVFRNIARVVTAGGLFAAEAGGSGNIANLLRAVADATGRNSSAARHFAGVDDTVRRLANAGFRDIDVSLVADPVEVHPALLESFLATIMLVPELETLPEAERPDFVRAVAKRMREPVIDYVRLRIAAIVR